MHIHLRYKVIQPERRTLQGWKWGNEEGVEEEKKAVSVSDPGSQSPPKQRTEVHFHTCGLRTIGKHYRQFCHEWDSMWDKFYTMKARDQLG